LPGEPPDSDLPPFIAPVYEPIWAVCEDLEMPINHHSGTAGPAWGPWEAHGSNFALDTPKGSAANEAQDVNDAGNYGERIDASSLACVIGGNQFPRNYANQGAIAALERWVRTGTPAPSAPAIQTTTLPNGQVELALDGYGNVMGGFRLQPVDTPVTTYLSTVPSSGSLSRSTRPGSPSCTRHMRSTSRRCNGRPTPPWRSGGCCPTTPRTSCVAPALRQSHCRRRLRRWFPDTRTEAP
jgi:hypothetical protein